MRILWMTILSLGVLTPITFAADDANPNKVKKGNKKATKKGAMAFDAMDKNSDGQLDGEEIPERLKRGLARIDTNGDGKISKDEFQAFTKRMEERRKEKGKAKPDESSSDLKKESDEAFARLDVNKDGKLQKSELPEGLRRIAEVADVDGDGALSREEMKDAGKVAGAFKPGLDKKSAKGGFTPDRLFDRFDQNKDGKLQLTELPEQLRDRLAAADTNGDGAVSKDEANAAMEFMKARFAEKKARGGGQAGPANRSPKQLFNDQDIDADGRVSKAEAKGILAEKFDKLDADKNGALDAREVENGLPATPPATVKGPKGG